MTEVIMCFVSVIQKLLDKGWHVITMFSVMPFTFNAVDLHSLTVNEKSWTPRCCVRHRRTAKNYARYKGSLQSS